MYNQVHFGQTIPLELKGEVRKLVLLQKRSVSAHLVTYGLLIHREMYNHYTRVLLLWMRSHGHIM